MLKVSQLMYQYGTQTVFSEIDFQLEANKVAMLIGRNGAGKSTLLRCLAGWTSPEKGIVEINGFTLKNHEQDFQKQNILVPDTPDFYDELTGWEHLQLVAQLHHIADWQETAQDLLVDLQLWRHRKAFPFTFSRGMRYKLALAMALLVRPPLLLLDEPFGPLDSLASEFLWENILEYGRDGNAVLFSSHIMPEGTKPDIFLLLRDGEMQSVDAETVNHMGELLKDA